MHKRVVAAELCPNTAAEVKGRWQNSEAPVEEIAELTGTSREFVLDVIFGRKFPDVPPADNCQ